MAVVGAFQEGSTEAVLDTEDLSEDFMAAAPRVVDKKMVAQVKTDRGI